MTRVDLNLINRMPDEELRTKLFQCCSSTRWVDAVSQARPFASVADFGLATERIWFDLAEGDWLEAFSYHPRIGDTKELARKFAATASLAGKEQAGVEGADSSIIEELAKKNDQYFNKFGFVFLICATGKSAEEMLMSLRSRLNNERSKEVATAAAEQNKITAIRLEKVFA